MKTAVIYTDIPLTEHDLKRIRKLAGMNCVYIPHDCTVIEYIDREDYKPKNITELFKILNKSNF